MIPNDQSYCSIITSVRATNDVQIDRILAFYNGAEEQALETMKFG